MPRLRMSPGLPPGRASRPAAPGPSSASASISVRSWPRPYALENVPRCSKYRSPSSPRPACATAPVDTGHRCPLALARSSPASTVPAPGRVAVQLRCPQPHIGRRDHVARLARSRTARGRPRGSRPHPGAAPERDHTDAPFSFAKPEAEPATAPASRSLSGPEIGTRPRPRCASQVRHTVQGSGVLPPERGPRPCPARGWTPGRPPPTGAADPLTSGGRTGRTGPILPAKGVPVGLDGSARAPRVDRRRHDGARCAELVHEPVARLVVAGVRAEEAVVRADELLGAVRAERLGALVVAARRPLRAEQPGHAGTAGEARGEAADAGAEAPPPCRRTRRRSSRSRPPAGCRRPRTEVT